MWKPLAVSILSVGLLALGYFFYLQYDYSSRFGKEYVSVQASRIMARVGGDYSDQLNYLQDDQAEKAASKEKLYVGLAGLCISILGAGLYFSAHKAETAARVNEKHDDDSLAARLSRTSGEGKTKGWDLVE